MKSSFLIIALFVFSSGLSAYIGNQYGRKIGKKKISIFSIRPKHSSTILTVVISMAISLALLGGLLVAHPPLKHALLNSETLATAPLTPMIIARQPLSAKPKPPTVKTKHSTTQLPKVTSQQPAVLPSSAPKRVSSLRRARRPSFTRAKTRRKVWSPKQSRRLLVAPKPHKTVKETGVVTHKNRQHLPPWIAKKNDTLFNLQIQGNQSEQSSEAVLAKALDLTQKYAKKMGAGTPGQPLIKVLKQDLNQAKTALKKSAHFDLRIQVAQATRQAQSLPVRFILKARKPPSLSPHDILEKERLKSTLQGRIQKDINKTIVAAIRLKESQGYQPPIKTLPPASPPAPTPSSGNSYESLPPVNVAFKQVRLLEVGHKGMTISGQLSIHPPSN